MRQQPASTRIGLGVILGNNHAYPLYRNRSANYDNKTNWWKQFWFYKLDVEGVGIANPTRKRFGAGVWHCPAQRSPPNDISYGYNAIGHVPVGTPYTNNLGLVNLFGLAGHYRYGANGDVPLAPSAEPEVVDPSETMAIGDTFEGILSFDHWYHFAATSKKWHAYSRHQGHLNVVFCDGHVESPTLQTLFEDNRDAALARWNRDHKRHRDKLGP